MAQATSGWLPGLPFDPTGVGLEGKSPPESRRWRPGLGLHGKPKRRGRPGERVGRKEVQAWLRRRLQAANLQLAESSPGPRGGAALGDSALTPAPNPSPQLASHHGLAARRAGPTAGPAVAERLAVPQHGHTAHRPGCILIAGCSGARLNYHGASKGAMWDV